MSNKKSKNFNLTSKEGRKKAMHFLAVGGASIAGMSIISIIAEECTGSAILAKLASIVPCTILIGDPITIAGIVITTALWTLFIKRNQLSITKKLIKLGKKQGLKKIKIRLDRKIGLSMNTQTLAGVPVSVCLGMNNSLEVRAKYR